MATESSISDPVSVISATTKSSTKSTSASLTSTASATLPTFSDNAPKPAQTTSAASGAATSSTSDNPSVGLVNYYFIFFALILCVGGLGGFYIWRRRRRAYAQFQNGRSDALERDVNAWDSTGRRRNWQTRWRSAEFSREEGLDENGEAPPPYMPKPHEENVRTDGTQDEGPHAEGDLTQPSIPLQTLSREAVGLKPPDYEEHTSEIPTGEGRSSGGSQPGSSRNPR